MSETTRVNSSELFYNSLTEGNIYAPNLRNNLAIGFWDTNQKGIAVFPDENTGEAARLLELLLAQAPDATFLLTGMPLINLPSSRTSQMIRKVLRPYNLSLEEETEYEGGLIYTKDLVLTGSEARILLRNEEGNLYDSESIITIPYSEP